LRIRGVIRDIARLLIKAHYGLEEPKLKDPCTVQNNQKKVEYLLSKKSFYCQVCCDFLSCQWPDSDPCIEDTASCTGDFEHPVIQAIVNGAWFRDLNAHGIKFSRYFTSHLPLPALAFVLTSVSLLDRSIYALICLQIEVVLDEWQTGEEKRVVFSEAEYKSKFEGHLARLKRWEVSVSYGMKEIRKDLINNGR
jgi:hypothetical protein